MVVSGNTLKAVLSLLNKNNPWLKINFIKNKLTIESMVKFATSSNTISNDPTRFNFANFNVNLNRKASVQSIFTISKNNNGMFYNVNWDLDLITDQAGLSKKKYVIPGIGIMKNNNLMMVTFNILTGVHSKDKNTIYTSLASLSGAKLIPSSRFGTTLSPILFSPIECLKWRVQGSGRVPKIFSEQDTFSQFQNLNGSTSFINSATKFDANLIMMVANQQSIENSIIDTYISNTNDSTYNVEYSMLYIGYPSLSGGDIYGVKVNGYSSTISIDCDQYYTGDNKWENIVIVGLVKPSIDTQQAFIITGGGTSLSVNPDSLYVNINSYNSSFQSVYSTSNNLIISGNSDSLESFNNVAFFYFVSYDNIESTLMNDPPTYYQYPNATTTVISNMKPINNNGSSGLYIISGGYSTSELEYKGVNAGNGSLRPSQLKAFITIYNSYNNTFTPIDLKLNPENSSIVSDLIPNYIKNQDLVAISVNILSNDSVSIVGQILVFDLIEQKILSILTNSSNTASNGESSISSLINNIQNESIFALGIFNNIDERPVSLISEIKIFSDVVNLDISYSDSNFSITGTGGTSSSNLYNGTTNQASITGPSNQNKNKKK